MARRSPRAAASSDRPRSRSARSPVTSRSRRSARPPMVRPSTSMKRSCVVRAVRRNASPRCFSRSSAASTAEASAGSSHVPKASARWAGAPSPTMVGSPSKRGSPSRPCQLTRSWRSEPISRVARSSAPRKAAISARSARSRRAERRCSRTSMTAVVAENATRPRNSAEIGVVKVEAAAEDSASPAGMSGSVMVRSVNGMAISAASAVGEAPARRLRREGERPERAHGGDGGPPCCRRVSSASRAGLCRAFSQTPNRPRRGNLPAVLAARLSRRDGTTR